MPGEATFCFSAASMWVLSTKTSMKKDKPDDSLTSKIIPGADTTRMPGSRLTRLPSHRTASIQNVNVHSIPTDTHLGNIILVCCGASLPRA